MHTYADGPANPSIIIDLVDEDGTHAAAGTLSITVSNVAPTVEAGTNQTVDEGDLVNLAPATFNDLGTLDNHTATIDWGDGTAVGVGTVSEAPFGPPGSTSGANGTVAGSHIFADNGTYTVTVCVKDDELAETCDALTVTVENVAPTVGPIDITPYPAVIVVGTAVNASATCTDPGTDDTHTAQWDWGDGIFTTVNLDLDEDEDCSVAASHTYNNPGVYTIELMVMDDDGDVGTSSFEFVVVYDPEGGFVTGGGWIDSPEGAYTADPLLSGKANFGFVSKYKKGQSVPSGQTEFQFQVANLNFHSDQYEWLVVANHKAMFKGTGTINDSGNYGFLVSAIDEKLTPSADEDLFRIKIWDKDNGDAVVYDNGLGADDDADPTTVIGGGSIVVHEGK